MAPQHRSVRMPSARKPDSQVTEAAPGVPAATHDAEQCFWKIQASYTQVLARSASIKQQYRAQVMSLRKSRRAAQCEVSRLQNLIKHGLAIVENANAEEKQGHSHSGHDKGLAELHGLVSRMKTTITTIAEQRDDALDRLHAANMSVVNITEEWEKCHDELEDLKTKARMWQDDSENAQVEEVKYLKSIFDLQSHLVKSIGALEKEQDDHNSTRDTLVERSNTLETARADLRGCQLEHQGLMAKHDKLVQHLGTLQDTYDKMTQERDVLQQDPDAYVESKAGYSSTFKSKFMELAETQRELRAAQVKIVQLEDANDMVKGTTLTWEANVSAVASIDSGTNAAAHENIKASKLEQYRSGNPDYDAIGELRSRATASMSIPALSRSDETCINGTNSKTSVIKPNDETSTVDSSGNVPTTAPGLVKQERIISHRVAPVPENANSTQLNLTKTGTNSKNPFASLETPRMDEEKDDSSDDGHEELDEKHGLDEQTDVHDQEDYDESNTDSATFIIDNGPAQSASVSTFQQSHSPVANDSISIPSSEHSCKTTVEVEVQESDKPASESENVHQAKRPTLAANAFDVFLDPSFYNEAEELDFNDSEGLIESDIFPQVQEQESESSAAAASTESPGWEHTRPPTRNFSSFTDLIKSAEDADAQHIDTPRLTFSPTASQFTPSFATPSSPSEAGALSPLHKEEDFAGDTKELINKLPSDTEQSFSIRLVASPVAVQDQPPKPDHEGSALINTKAASASGSQSHANTPREQKYNVFPDGHSAHSAPSHTQAQAPEPTRLFTGMMSSRWATDSASTVSTPESSNPLQQPSQAPSYATTSATHNPTEAPSQHKALEPHKPSASILRSRWATGSSPVTLRPSSIMSSRWASSSIGTDGVSPSSGHGWPQSSGRGGSEYESGRQTNDGKSSGFRY